MTATTTRFEPGTLAQLPPADLVLERNIRAIEVDPDLVASIRDVGVLQPITAVVGPDGRPIVRLGHRRTLAAVEAGVATVPVYFAGIDDTADASEVIRIVEQYDENTRRWRRTARSSPTTASPALPPTSSAPADPGGSGATSRSSCRAPATAAPRSSRSCRFSPPTRRP